MNKQRYDTVSIVENKYISVNQNLSLTRRYIRSGPSYTRHGDYPKPKRFPIEQFPSLRDQEASLVQDMLDVLAGFEGYYIRYASRYDPDNLSDKLIGPEYLINKRIDTGFKDLIKRMVKLGKIYSSLCGFNEVYGGLVHGSTVQALCHEIHMIIKDYEQALVRIEDSFKCDPKFSLTMLEHKLNEPTSKSHVSISTKLRTTYEICQGINLENEKRSNATSFDDLHFANIMRSLKCDKYTGTLDGVTSDSDNSRCARGGIILCIIQTVLDKYRGNQAVYLFLVGLYNRISVDYVLMLNKWLNMGKIDDPYDEFLISDNIPDITNKYGSMQWADRFTIRSEGLPKQFSELDCQKKLVLTGKYMNVVTECLGSQFCSDHCSNIKIDSMQDEDLMIKVNAAYNHANTCIYNMLFKSYYLDQWIKYINITFLLVDSAQFDKFLDFAFVDVGRSFDSASLSILQRQYKASLSDIPHESYTRVKSLVENLSTLDLAPTSFLGEISTILNVQTTEAQEVFASKDIGSLKRLLEEAMKSTSEMQKTNEIHSRMDKFAIDRLTLIIHIPFPINLIITDSQLFEYQLIFREQALLRFVDKAVTKGWLDITHNLVWKYGFADERTRPYIWKCRIINQRFIKFIRILQFYINFDVIETKRSGLSRSLRGNDLEDIYLQFKTFLNNILDDSMLTKLKLMNVLHSIFSLILKSFFMFNNSTGLLTSILNITSDQDSSINDLSPEELSTQLQSSIKTLDNYDQQFALRLKELYSMLGYYGELDSGSLLLLRDELQAAFKLEYDV